MLDLTAAQDTKFGKALQDIFYKTDLISVMGGVSGYPHNGGEHTLKIKNKKDELIAFLDLFEECLGYKFNEISLVRDEIEKGETQIKLKNLVAWFNNN